MDKAAELLDPKAAVWDDDVLTEDELRDVMSQVVKALSSAPIEDQEKAIRSCMYNFEGERQAAMGNMTSKAVMIKAVRAAVSLLGCDGAKSNPTPSPNPNPNPNPNPDPNPNPNPN